MKYFSFSALLFLAVLFFGCNANEQKASEPAAPSTTMETTAAAGGGAGQIVYVNTDTLLNRYDYFQEQMDSLAGREQAANAELNRRATSLEQEFRSVQKRVQEGLLTPNQIAQEEQRLSAAQQEIMIEKERLGQELMVETDRINKELRTTLKELLSRIREEQGYDYILQYGQGSNVLMVNPALDITPMVLTELNKKEQ